MPRIKTTFCTRFFGNLGRCGVLLERRIKGEWFREHCDQLNVDFFWKIFIKV